MLTTNKILLLWLTTRRDVMGCSQLTANMGLLYQKDFLSWAVTAYEYKRRLPAINPNGIGPFLICLLIISNVYCFASLNTNLIYRNGTLWQWIDMFKHLHKIKQSCLRHKKIYSKSKKKKKGTNIGLISSACSLVWFLMNGIFHN